MHRLGEVAQKGGDRRSDRRTCRRQEDSSGTVNRELATLSHLFGQASEWGWSTNAKPRMKRMKEGDGRIVYLTAEQAQALLAAATASDNTHNSIPSVSQSRSRRALRKARCCRSRA